MHVRAELTNARTESALDEEREIDWRGGVTSLSSILRDVAALCIPATASCEPGVL